MNSSNSIPRDRIGMGLLQCSTNSKVREGEQTRRLQWKGKTVSCCENKLQSTRHLDKLICTLPKLKPDIFILLGVSSFWFMEILENLLLNSTSVIKPLHIALLEYFRESVIKSSHLLQVTQPFPSSWLRPWPFFRKTYELQTIWL